MLQFPGILLPIAVTLVAVPEQEYICQIVGLVCPNECFAFVVTFVFIAGQDVSSVDIWGDTEAVDWLVQTLQSKSPTQGNSLCGASRVFKTEHYYSDDPFPLFWFGSPWIFSVSYEALGSLGLCSPPSCRRSQHPRRICPCRAACGVSCQLAVVCIPSWLEIFSEGESVEDFLSSDCIIFQPHKQ